MKKFTDKICPMCGKTFKMIAGQQFCLSLACRKRANAVAKYNRVHTIGRM